MMRKPLLLLVLFIALAAAALLVWRWLGSEESVIEYVGATTKPSNEMNSNAVSGSTNVTQGTRSDGTSNAKGNIVPTLPERPLYQMAATNSSFDPAIYARREENAPFRIQGRGSKAKIVTAEGKTLIEADKNVGIYKCVVSPNGRRIIVYYGNATYDVVTPDTGETVRLPPQPPGENVLSFASWHWIDDQTLIGVSGKTIPFRNGQIGVEREEPMISGSVLYAYDLKKRKLSEVVLPRALRTKILSVNAVDETGKLQLRLEGQTSPSDASLSWFKVRPKE